MNKIFKIIWNKTTQRLEVVSELAKSQGKATASADNRASLSSAKFRISLLALTLFSISSVSIAAGNYGDNRINGTFALGSANTYGDRLNTDRTKPFIVGATNHVDISANAVSANIFGRNNTALYGNRVNIFGDNNDVSGGNAVDSSDLLLSGSNNHIENPGTYGTVIGHKNRVNNSPLAIGHNLTVHGGGYAVGDNIHLDKNTVASGGFAGNGGFAVGKNIKAIGDSFIVGRNIYVDKNATGATNLNRNSVYFGDTINSDAAFKSVFIGNGITSSGHEKTN